MRYLETCEAITVQQLQGFFIGWPNPPSPEKHLELLAKSDFYLLAIDEQSERVVGFITAISDHVLSAYIPLLEVLPAYQGQGIGTELVQRMLAKLKHFYMIDLLCDPQLQTFYEHLGMRSTLGMCVRNYTRQNGK